MKKTAFVIVWIERCRKKKSPGLSKKFEERAAVSTFPASQSMFYFCIFFNIMYVVSQVGDFCSSALLVWVSRRRCGIVALVSYTGDVLSVVLVEGQKIRNQIDFYIMFTYFSKKLKIFN